MLTRFKSLAIAVLVVGIAGLTAAAVVSAMELNREREARQRAAEELLYLAEDVQNEAHLVLNMLEALPFGDCSFESIVELRRIQFRARRIRDIGVYDNGRAAVVAEGVETAEQAALVSQLGIRFAQGYYYAKPVDVDTFAALLSVGFLQPATASTNPV
ncbi:sensor c-di-GMP phosphodiesterase-like protein [Natronocella acetinitrilica]|uniref:cyclic-guanylate-specific phosphodiesterase n=1 Tax=Natronocella acetinitrilica TaxID=414046 RepID=A0AAE3G5Z2_9GAMM|nr:sensor c-di-GMP phosphodiesterase-like protein [Natronocella acetinitrilica]